MKTLFADIEKGRPILMDGATGTKLWAMAEAAGVEKVPVWIYNLAHPEFVKSALMTYLRAGSRVVMTNTFTVNRYELKPTEYEVAETIAAALRIAREAVAEFEAEKTDDIPVRVMLDVGPLPILPEPYGDHSEEECAELFREIFTAGKEAGADGIMMETFYDINLMGIAVREAKKTGLPVFATMTFQNNGRTHFGFGVPEICEVLEREGAEAIGLNCSLGPAEALPVIKEFAAHTTLPLIAKPNAGLPSEVSPDTVPYTAETFLKDLLPALPYLTYVGACCGSDENFITALRDEIMPRR